MPEPTLDTEVDDFLTRAADELRGVLGDGNAKRRAGEKPPWWEDSHEVQLFSHLYKWKKGELKDADSGKHPLVHLACRALMIAMTETENTPAGDEARRTFVMHRHMYGRVPMAHARGAHKEIHMGAPFATHRFVHPEVLHFHGPDAIKYGIYVEDDG